MTSVADRGVRFAGVLAWLDDPSPERGLRFAGDRGDGWDFYSYRQLRDAVMAVAARLRAAGVGSGETVLLVCPTSPAFVAGFFGALVAGAVPSPAAPPGVFADRERYFEHLGRVARTIAARVVLTVPELAQRLAPFASTLGAVLVTESATGSRNDAPAPTAELGEPPPPDDPDSTEDARGIDMSGSSTALIQFSSGSTGHPRGARVSLNALNANVAAIHQWLNYGPADSLASWLPLHHDMGLIGCLVAPMAAATDVWLMSPEQFIHSPARWLRCFGNAGVTTTATPSFGLAHVLRRTRPEQLSDLDFRGWRTLIVGAERVDLATVEGFLRLVIPRGFDRRAVLPAYGMAEATLAVTGSSHREEVRTATIDASSLRLGQPVTMVERTSDSAHTLVACGSPLTGMQVAVVNEADSPIDTGSLGELVVSGASLADGYAGPGTDEAFGGVLRTGDAGFFHEGQLYVIGRLGDGVKQLGRWLFAEDIEQVAARASRRPHRTVALLGNLDGRDTAVVAIEGRPGDTVERVGRAVANHAPHARVLVLAVPNGWIARTTSGKPMRRAMWARMLTADRRGAQVVWDSGVARVEPGWTTPP